MAHAAGKGMDQLYHANSSGAGYDGLDRLKEWHIGTLAADNGTLTGTPARGHEFALDALGNWSSFTLRESGSPSTQARQHNKANEIDTNDDHADTGDSITGTPNYVDPVYDAAGNMTKIPSFSQPTAVGTICRYDAWNRLVSLAPEQMPSMPWAKYQFDGLHRRIAKLITSSPNWNRTDYYYNEDWQVLEERTGSVAGEQTAATTLSTQWLWDARYIDTPIVRWHDGDAASATEPDGDFADAGEVLYYTTDANINVTALVDGSSGAQAGNVVERYAYDSYGRCLTMAADYTPITWNASKQNEIRYCGYRADPETMNQSSTGWQAHLYQVRFREYDPSLGRWLQRDDDYIDGFNLTEYVSCNPLAYIDEDGAKKKPVPGIGPKPKGNMSKGDAIAGSKKSVVGQTIKMEQKATPNQPKVTVKGQGTVSSDPIRVSVPYRGGLDLDTGPGLRGASRGAAALQIAEQVKAIADVHMEMAGRAEAKKQFQPIIDAIKEALDKRLFPVLTFSTDGNCGNLVSPEKDRPHDTWGVKAIDSPVRWAIMQMYYLDKMKEAMTNAPVKGGWRDRQRSEALLDFSLYYRYKTLEHNYNGGVNAVNTVFKLGLLADGPKLFPRNWKNALRLYLQNVTEVDPDIVEGKK